MDVGLFDPDAPDAHTLLTHAEAHCLLTKENSPSVYVKHSASPDGGPGEVFDDEEPAEVNVDDSSGWALLGDIEPYQDCHLLLCIGRRHWSGASLKDARPFLYLAPFHFVVILDSTVS